MSNINSVNDPLANKIMVLYVLPRDPASQNALQLIQGDFPEILIQDASQIYPRPNWLQGVPTIIVVSDKSVHAGPQALYILNNYVQASRSRGGAQSNMVVPTLNPDQFSPVANGPSHENPFVEEKQVSDTPVGTSVRKGMAVGTLDYSSEQDARYFQSTKVNETDVTNYMAMRNQPRQRPVNWRPSVLDNGEMVSM